MNDEDLLELFLQEGWEGLSTLESVIVALRAGADDGTSRDAYYGALSMGAHRLRGTAGLYGYPQLAALAALAERLTDPRPQLLPKQRDQLLDLLELLTLGLHRALTGIGAGQGEGELGLFFAEVGGAQALQALLRAAPSAFAARRPEEGHGSPTLEAKLPETVPGGPEAELQGFVRQNAELWSFFAPEAREYLDVLRTELEKGLKADVLLLFRAAHTLKGSAFMVGLPLMGQLAHRLEDLMDAVRELRVPLEGSAAKLLLEGTALLEQMLLTAEGTPDLSLRLLPALRTLERQVQTLLSGDNPEPVPEDPRPPAESELDGLTLTSSVAPSPAGQLIRVSSERLDGLMDKVGQLIMSRARLDNQLERLSQIEESFSVSHARVQRVVRDFEEKYLNSDMLRDVHSDSAQTGADNGTDTTELDKLRGTISEVFEELEFDSYDDMNILARSVTEMSADLGELRRQLSMGGEALRDETATFSKLLRTLRADVARTRRVTLAQAYVRPRRWARGQTHADLTLMGSELEVDAFLAQGISEVLLHLVTNAFTHGQEHREERERSGKPPRGQVNVVARQNGTLLELSVSDDGRGISTSRVRDQALARGLRSARELNEMNDEEVLRLILLPGLSTAPEVTSEAGRGVGMDIVASTVRRMGGEFQIATQPGEGTTFTLRLPLTQQVVDLLTVQVGPYRLGFSTANIAGLRSVQASEVLGDGEQRRLPDGTPLYLLQPLWNPAQWSGSQPGGEFGVVVIRTAAGEVAFGVDAFGSIAEAVIEPPGFCLEALGYVSGTTVAADGTPVLLPDAAGLIRLVRSWNDPATEAQTGARAPQISRLLLVDDSLSVRRAVSRMLERAGHQVVTASDGLEALELLRDGLQVQAVLTDLEMPRANGFEVIEEVRRHYPHLPVVVMTTRSGEKHQRLAFQLGASDYFSKPVDEALLTRCLAQLLVVGVSASGTLESGDAQTL